MSTEMNIDRQNVVIHCTNLSENRSKQKTEEVEKSLFEPINNISAPTPISSCIKGTTAPFSDFSLYWQSKEAQAIFQPNESES
jgi:hypothetical protein